MKDMKKKLPNDNTELTDEQLDKVSGGASKSGQSTSEGLGLPSWMDPVVNKISDIVNKK